MRSKVSIRAAVLAAATLAAGAAVAAPLPLAAGASGSVPVYDGRTPTTTTLLGAACGYFSGATCTTGTSVSALESTGESILASSGGFIEAAGVTALNPFDTKTTQYLAFAFILGGSDVTSLSSVIASSFGGYKTSVEACGPIFGSEFEGCSSGSPGTATRSAGTGVTAGNSITFSKFPSPNLFLGFYPYTDGYVIYTNAPASALTDPNNFEVTLSTGGSYSFAGLGLTAPSTSGGGTGVPEPATLGLLGLGLAGLRFARRRRQG